MKERKLEKFWRESIFEHVPHGEDGSLQCTEDEAVILCRLLLKKGFAVCITGGDIGDECNVNWIYAGSTDNLQWANYDNIVFTSYDYIEDYPQAIQENIEEALLKEEHERNSWLREEDYVD